MYCTKRLFSASNRIGRTYERIFTCPYNVPGTRTQGMDGIEHGAQGPRRCRTKRNRGLIGNDFGVLSETVSNFPPEKTRHTETGRTIPSVRPWITRKRRVRFKRRGGFRTHFVVEFVSRGYGTLFRIVRRATRISRLSL